MVQATRMSLTSERCSTAQTAPSASSFITVTHGSSYQEGLTGLEGGAITQKYSGLRKITHTKYQHLQELKAVIPRVYHPFYDALPHD
jgi:hypothetical protein